MATGERDVRDGAADAELARGVLAEAGVKKETNLVNTITCQNRYLLLGLQREPRRKGPALALACGGVYPEATRLIEHVRHACEPGEG